MMRHATLFAGSAACLVAAPAADARDIALASAEAGGEDLSDLTIEELARINVRSASKRDEPLSAAPTALFVITGEEIEATPATSLAEALRLAPGLSSYVEAESRLAYRIGGNLELYVAGRNLLHQDHAESDDVQRGQRAERSLYAGTRVRS